MSVKELIEQLSTLNPHLLVVISREYDLTAKITLKLVNVKENEAPVDGEYGVVPPSAATGRPALCLDWDDELRASEQLVSS